MRRFQPIKKKEKNALTGFFISYPTFVCTIAAKWCTKTPTNYISFEPSFRGACRRTGLEPVPVSKPVVFIGSNPKILKTVKTVQKNCQ